MDDALKGTAARPLALLALISGAVVATWLAAHGHAQITTNFLVYWLPHAVILGLLWLSRASKVLMAGVATALALYLALYGAWVLSMAEPGGLIWLGYLCSFPGAFLAAAVARYIEWTARPCDRPWLTGFVCVALGLTLNQGAVCSTVMACRLE
ncbi:hypothetical protein [Pseudomonas sp. RIT-To-2]|uniref:hypothetical protein n=1 Tax=Pseudomonas sp. RIT-To-2 TaxID=3462541 RepID=UPI001303E4C0